LPPSLPSVSSGGIYAHRYDTPYNVSFYVRAHPIEEQYPENVKLYVNENLVANIGDLGENIGYSVLNSFSDGEEIKVFNYTRPRYYQYGSIRIPKGLEIVSANITVIGSQYNSVYPSNVLLEVGRIDNSPEWTHSGTLDSVEVITGLKTSMDVYRQTVCASTAAFCDIPIIFYSSTNGTLFVWNIDIELYRQINPIILDINVIKEYLKTQVAGTTIPLEFESDGNGIIEIYNVSYVFAGGNATINVTGSNWDSSSSVSRNITYFHSGWEAILPSGVTQLDFFPPTPNSKNVEPFGQNMNIPFYNITFGGYGGKSANFTIFQNLSLICVDLMAKVDNIIYNINENEWLQLKDYMLYGQNFGIWLYANYSCNFNDWFLFNPDSYLRACCEDCICGEELN